MRKPRIIIPIGDVAGVGPEIVVKALRDPELFQRCVPIVVGEKSCMQRAIDVCGTKAKLHVIGHTQDAQCSHGVIDLIDLHNIDAQAVPFGQVSALAGKAAFDFIAEAVNRIHQGQADAMATTTINKEALKAAKVPYIGHTEILEGLTNVANPMTMFQVKALRVLFLTRHLSLMDAIKAINKEKLYRFIHRAKQAMTSIGIPQPRIAVAGLNPHSGEHGLFGMEEVEAVMPAIDAAQKDGIAVFGPIGADSVFHQALQGMYDVVISLYHDQGHIATKMVDFERTISLTIGLPFLRTSVDHGTAFDIAGTNKVSEVSMVYAIQLAAEYSGIYSDRFFRPN